MYLSYRTSEKQPILASRPTLERRITWYFANRYIQYISKGGGPGTMGRFGGGWNIAFGFEAANLNKMLTLDGLIVNLFVFALRFGKQSEHINEAKARELDRDTLPRTARESLRQNIRSAEALIALAKAVNEEKER